MKKIIFLFTATAMILWLTACERDYAPSEIQAHYQIDSIWQDSVILAGDIVIPTVVHVNYTIINDGPVDINAYRYTINAKNADNYLFQIAESHYNPVPAGTERQDHTKIGVGSQWVNKTRVWMDNTSFQ